MVTLVLCHTEYHGNPWIIHIDIDPFVGDTYEGDWVEGAMEGKGVMRYADGGIYEVGRHQQDLRHQPHHRHHHHMPGQVEVWSKRGDGRDSFPQRRLLSRPVGGG